MSTSLGSRKTTRNGGQTSPGKTRGRGGRDAEPSHSGKSRNSPSALRSGDVVWGKTPRRRLDQKGLTFLFAEQKRLNAALRRQARLARLDVAEVRSTEAELLRRINQQIADGFALEEGKNPFSSRQLSDSQIKSEELLKRQGARFSLETTERVRNCHRPPTQRRRTNLGDLVLPKSLPREEFTTLRGPLLRCLARSKDRGYRGTPSQWLRGPTAMREINRLRQKGMIHPLWTGRLSVFDRFCPLRYAVTGCTATSYQVPSRGFQGERLYDQNRDSLVLVRQARSVKRLTASRWPRTLSGARAWPTFPTFNESWEMLMRGISPVSISTPEREKFFPWKRPTAQLKAGLKVRTISNMVIGVRASVAVPVNLLAYFTYRWGFLILKRNRPLPNQLASYLAGLWKSDISGLFLKFPIRYNDALRRTPPDTFYAVSGWRKEAERAPAVVKLTQRRRDPLRSLRRLHLRKAGNESSSPSRTTTSNQSGGGVRLH